MQGRYPKHCSRSNAFSNTPIKYLSNRCATNRTISTSFAQCFSRIGSGTCKLENFLCCHELATNKERCMQVKVDVPALQHNSPSPGECPDCKGLEPPTAQLCRAPAGLEGLALWWMAGAVDRRSLQLPLNPNCDDHLTAMTTVAADTTHRHEQKAKGKGREC